MNILLTGATGFIGRALVLRLRRDGHIVRAVVRDPERGRSLLGTEAQLVTARTPGDWDRALDGIDAVVNLAGEPVMGDRWTAERRRALTESRVGVTRALVEAVGRSVRRPRVLVSSSAVGYYGDGGDEVLTESSPHGEGFLADLCRAWEAEAFKAQEHGVRVTVCRTGFVLGRGGGALARMLPIFRAGLGGSLGSGRQYVPWIHLDDLVELLTRCVTEETYDGAFNGAAPAAVPFSELARALGRAVGRPTIIPAPALALRAAFGAAADVLLQGQRAFPERAMGLGFPFRFTDLDVALSDITGSSDIDIARVSGTVPESPYLSTRPPAYDLATETRLARPLDEVFPFFSRPENLGLITPPAMRFRITDMPESIGEGSEIAYRLRVGPVPIRWRTRIDAWEDGRRFVDSQLDGPYASWWHEHTFRPDGTGTAMTDRVLYAPPLGPLGRVANRVLIADQLREIFGYRAAVMRLRFGTA